MIATLDELAAGLAEAQSFPIRKSQMTTKAYGYAGLFLADGFPGAGVAPVAAGTNGAFVDSSLAGALPLEAPGAGNSLNLGRMMGAATVGSTALVVYDRIWHNLIGGAGAGSGFSALVSITWPTVGTQRHATVPGVELWAEIMAPLANTTTTTWAVSYRDQDDVLQTATAAYDTASNTGRMIPFTVASGTTAIKSVVSFTAGTSQASGSVSLVLLKRVAELPILTGPATQDGITLGLPALDSAACLCMMSITGSAGVSGDVLARLDVVEG